MMMGIGSDIYNPPSNAGGGGGIVAQRVSFFTGSSSTGTTTIPSDNTIPQNTEGDQYMTLSITPKNASDVLVVSVIAMVATNVASIITMALFQDSNVNALSASATQTTAANEFQTMALVCTVPAGAVSATTFNVRIGSAAGATVTFNGAGGTQKYGGAANSGILIQEFTS